MPFDNSATANYINQLMNPPDPNARFNSALQGLDAYKQFQAKQAAADAYRQSVDPTTGQVDQGRFNALMSQGTGAWNLGESMRSIGQGVQAQGLGTTADVNAKLDQLNAVGRFMYPLLQKASDPTGPGVSGDEVQQQLDQAHGMGLINDQQYQRVSGEIAKIPPGGNANSIVLGANMGNQAAIGLLTGNVTGVNAGPQTVFRQTAPLGAPSPAAPVTMGLSPQNVTQVQQWLTEPFSWPDANGNMQQGTKGGYLQSRGIDPMQYFNNRNVPAPGSPPPSVAGPLSGVTTGRQPVGAPTQTPAQPQQPGAPQTVPAVPPPAPGTSVGTTSEQLPPAVVEAGQKDYIAAQAASQTMNTRIAPLRNALSILRTNPDLQTGPGVAQWNQAVTGAAAALNLPVPQGTSDNQELTKYLAQYVRNQNTGGQTDLGRLETEAANPNPTTQSREALQVLTAKAVGVERLRTAALDYFNSQFPDATAAARNSGRYTVMTTDWMKRQDPTAYAVDAMTPEQVARYFNGLSGTVDKNGKATGDKAAFYRSMQDARRLYGASMQPSPSAATVAPPGP